MSEAGYIEDLQRIVPAKCMACGILKGHTDDCRLNRFAPFPLVIDPPLREDIDGWGHIGNRIISYAIVHVWQINKFLEPAAGSPAGIWVLTERGQLAADRKLKDEEILMPDTALQPGETATTDIVDTPTEGLLFTRGGTCTLCQKKMDVFGQISHAKSHINKGHPVMIEEMTNGKKLARVTSDSPTPVTPPTSRPPVDQGEFVGSALFSSTGICRLCPLGSGSVHKFGQISHAKSHMKRGHAVEIQTIAKKNVPVVVGDIIPPPPTRAEAEPYKPEQANGEYVPQLSPAEAQAREEGINAILTLHRAAGLTEDRETAGKNWDNMGPVTKMQTVRTAARLEKP